MRMSREDKARHHDEIVTSASRLLRTNGIGGTSVADLMQAAGFTHGGFYRHFDSKDELVVEAANAAFDEFVSDLETSIEKEGSAVAVSKFVEKYLSRGHVANPERGCPLVALGTEASREDKQVRKVFSDRSDRLFDDIAGGLTGSPTEQREKAIRLLSTLVGAIVLARAVGNASMRDEILSACSKTRDRPKRAR